MTEHLQTGDARVPGECDDMLDIHHDTPRYSQKPEGMTPLVDYDPVTGGIG
jgi:hypothetical protein